MSGDILCCERFLILIFLPVDFRILIFENENPSYSEAGKLLLLILSLHFFNALLIVQSRTIFIRLILCSSSFYLIDKSSNFYCLPGTLRTHHLNIYNISLGKLAFLHKRRQLFIKYTNLFLFEKHRIMRI